MRWIRPQRRLSSTTRRVRHGIKGLAPRYQNVRKVNTQQIAAIQNQEQDQTSKKKLGDKLKPLTVESSNPAADMFFLGPRLALGALLSSGEAIQNLTTDLDKVRSIVSDASKPMEEKQEEILMEVEERMAQFVEKGIDIENDMIGTLAGMLPDDVKESLPGEVRDVLLTPRRIAQNEEENTRSVPSPGAPLATWTITSIDEDEVDVNGAQYGGSQQYGGEEDAMVVSPVSMAQSQAAAELMEIQESVTNLRECIEKLNNNNEQSKRNMLKLNVREAKDNVAQRLEQVSSVSRSGDPDVRAAMEEASQLLQEVESMF